MDWLRQLRFRLFSLFRRRQLEADMAEEMQAHLDHEIAANRAAGMNAEEAHQAAHRNFGGMEQAKEHARDQSRFVWLEQGLQDLRYAFRQSSRHPGFSLCVVLILAIAIGANTAVFALTRSLLIKPLPWPQADRLVYVYNTAANYGWPLGPISVPDYLDRRDKTDCFTDATLFKTAFFNCSNDSSPQQVLGLQVTPSFFSTLGAAPLQGRLFTDSEAVSGKDKVAVISYSLWQRQFAGRDDILGSDLHLDGESYRVIGVMPEGFLPPNIGLFGVNNLNAQVWIPYAFTKTAMSDQWRSNWSSWMIARLKTGVSIPQAQEQIDIVQQRNAARFHSKSVPRQEGGFGGIVAGYREQNIQHLRPTLLILQAAVALILIIACANIGNLMLARTIARSRELSTRIALGCGRLRLARQLFTESLVMVAAGGALGMLLAYWSLELILRVAGQSLPLGQIIAVDNTVIGFALLLAVGAGVFFGFVPLISLRQHYPSRALRYGGIRVSAGKSVAMMRAVLIVTEVALALMLLAASGLTLRSLVNLHQVPTGFTTDRILTAKITLPVTEYKAGHDRSTFYTEALRNIRALPGVISASAISHLPFGSESFTSDYTIRGQVSGESSPGRNAQIKIVDPAYFQTMHIPLRRGRFFSATDSAGATPTVIIDRFLAQRCFPGRDPIGQQIKCPDRTPAGNRWCTIVGIVNEVKTASLAKDVVKETLYFPLAQRPEAGMAPSMSFVLKSKVEPTALAAALQKTIQQIDPSLPIYDVHTMDERIADSLTEYRAPTILLVAFGTAALALTIMGLHAVLAYLVNQRTREIGIRIALGAQARAILTMVVSQGMRLTVIGIVLGLAASFGLNRYLQSLLFGITANDPMTYIGAACLLMGVAAIACYLPARRAAKVDPAVTLRAE